MNVWPKRDPGGASLRRFLSISHYLHCLSLAEKFVAQNHSFRGARIFPEEKLKDFHQYSRLKIAHALFNPYLIESVTCRMARTLPKKCDR
jgi:hypothetical protein